MNIPKLLSGRRRRPAWSDRATEAEDPEPRQLAYLNWVAATVGEYGWAVSGTRGGDQEPPWAYSVGMWLSNAGPELIVCGLPLESAASIINAIGARVADGADIAPGVMLDDVCQAPLTFRPVDMSWRSSGLMSVSDAFYGMVRPPYLQVVWPDKNDRFPMDPGFQRGFEEMQPMLWLPRDDNPPSPWTRLGQTR
jgi:uncharacterized protein DUF4262